MSWIFNWLLVHLFILKATTTYVHPYPARTYYPREPRPMPREVMPYVVDPRYMTNYVNSPAYPRYATPEPPNPVYTYEIPERTYPGIHEIPEITYPDIQPKPPVPTPVIELPKIQEANPSRIGGLDPDVLNNLAIALQLLIINNLVNNPISEAHDLTQPKKILAELKGVHSEYEYPYAMPSSKFLGSNNFGDDGLASMADYGHSAPMSPRANMMLMSPYDAIARSSCTEQSPSKRDFQNPYSSIIAADYNKDLFSMNDLF